MALDELAEDLGGEDEGLGLGLGDEKSSGPTEPFEIEATVALDPKAPMADRLMALKEAIKLCLEQDLEGGYDKPPPKKGDGADLAIVFGGPPKKKG